MFYQVNEIIDINLQLLFSSKNQSLKYSEFKDNNGKKLGKIMELFHLMEKENLITIENNKCHITEFGKNIVENGGWFEHLKKKEETEKKRTEELKKNQHLHKKTKKKKSVLIGKSSFFFITNHFKNILKKRKT